jgi:predicted ATPase
MIERLRLQNFKCFADQKLRLKPLTLFTGVNGMGKSTTLQALLLLRQSYQQGLLRTKGLALNGDLTHIGTARDALFEDAGKIEGAGENVIGLSLTAEQGQEKRWLFGFPYEANEARRLAAPGEADVLELISSAPDSDAIYASPLFGDKFHYLQAERLGPRRFFDTSDFLVRQQRQLGASGEYTAHFLSVFGSEDIRPELAREDASSLSLLDQVEIWLNEISPGTKVVLAPNANTDTVSVQYSFLKKAQQSEDVRLWSNNYRATNVGFGITYILPILVAVLSSSPGALLLLENPEAHLHPHGQAMMGELLARAAACGIQIVVETHSDHVLNGIRVAVYNGKVQPDNVQLHYFQRSEQDGFAEVISPNIDRDGRIDRWPDGFFDEWDKNLEALLTPREE